MASYPNQGSSPYGDQLRAYIDEGDARSLAAKIAAEKAVVDAENAITEAQQAQSGAEAARETANSSATAASDSASSAASSASGAAASATEAQGYRDQAVQIVIADADQAMATAINEPGSATETALSASTRLLASSPLLTMYAGLRGYAYGNSWVAADTQNTAGLRYVDQIFDLLDLAAPANLATSGYRMQDTALAAVGVKTANTWTVASNGVVIVGDLLNNLIEADDSANRAAALESARALVATLSAKARIEESDFALSTSPAWTEPSRISPFASGGACAHTTTDGCTAEYVIRRPGTYYALMHGCDGVTLIGGQARIYKNDALVDTVELNAQSKKTTLAANQGVSPVVARLEGLVPGDSIRVEHDVAGRSGSVHLYFDGLLEQWGTPPLVVMVKPVQVLAASHDKPSLLTYLRTIPDVIAAEFPNVIVVDPADGWNPATMLGADNLHPNDAGENHITAAIISTLNEAVFTLVALAVRQQWTESVAPDQFFRTLAADDFTRGDSTTLGSTPTGSVSWDEASGDWAISSNRLVATTAPARLRLVVEEPTDIISRWTSQIGQRDGGTSILWRCADANNWYGAVATGSSLIVYKCEAGTTTAISSNLGSTANGDVIGVEIDPNTPDTFTLLINGTVVGSVTDGTFPAATGRTFGLACGTTSAKFVTAELVEVYRN